MVNDYKKLYHSLYNINKFVFYVQAIGLFLETNDKYLSSTNFGYLFENALIYGIIENSEKFVF